MRFSSSPTLLALCTLLQTSCEAFTALSLSKHVALTPSFPTGQQHGERQSAQQTNTKLSSEESDDNDWFADFNPADYQGYNQETGYFGGQEPPQQQQDSGYGGRRREGGGRPRRGGGGGGGGGGHDYTRDTMADNSNVDADTINNLISERLTYRKTGRYDEADDIRDVLLNTHGVMIRDKDRTWRSGCSAGGSGRQWMSGGGGRDNNRGGDRRGGDRRGGDRRGGNRRSPPPRDFGPNGHDYSLSSDAGSNDSTFSDEEIHALIKERLECKMSRDFRNADAIQQELLQAGVYIHDGLKQWRADGQTFEGYGAKNYRMVGPEPPTDDIDTIQDLVQKRARCKAERLYNEADSIRDDLMDNYGVYIDDRTREWGLGTGRGNNRREREFTPFAIHPESERPADHDEIQTLVEEREAARADRDFDAADAIRDDLMDRDIFINDRQRNWSVGKIMEGSRPKAGFTRRGSSGSDLSPEDEETIVSMLQTRDEHKRNRKFKSADNIRDKLRDLYNVRIDDRNQEWHIVTEDYTFVPESSEPLDPETQSYIEEQIKKRATAKLQKEYDVADAIREELTEKYQVSIDDRVKEWAILAAPHQALRNYFDENGTSETVQEQDEESFEVESSVEEEVEEDEDEEIVAGEEEDSFISAEDHFTAEDLAQLTVPELKEKLKAASLPVSGKKAELIARLTSTP